MVRPVGLCLLVCFGLACLRADTPSRAVDVPWIDRPTTKPWLPAITAAADRTGLRAELIAELIGTESGFQSVKNPHSSAFGCGQQIIGNDVMRRYHLDRTKCDQSIMGAALELREKWDRSGSLDKALLAYGTTSGLTTTRRRQILARMYAAAGSEAYQLANSDKPRQTPTNPDITASNDKPRHGSDAYQLPGQDVRLQPALALQPAQDRKRLDVAGDLDHLGAGRHQPR